MLAIAAALLSVFEASGHQLAVLPADASPGPVLASAALLAVAFTLVEEKLRRVLN